MPGLPVSIGDIVIRMLAKRSAELKVVAIHASKSTERAGFIGSQARKDELLESHVE